MKEFKNILARRSHPIRAGVVSSGLLASDNQHFAHQQVAGEGGSWTPTPRHLCLTSLGGGKGKWPKFPLGQRIPASGGRCRRVFDGEVLLPTREARHPGPDSHSAPGGSFLFAGAPGQPLTPPPGFPNPGTTARASGRERRLQRRRRPRPADRFRLRHRLRRAGRQVRGHRQLHPARGALPLSGPNPWKRPHW